MGFDNILDILKKAQRRHPAFGKRLQEAEALGRWEDAVGPGIAKHSRALRVLDSVLWVEVDHPIWQSELHHRKRQILDLLNTGREAAADGSTKAMTPAKQALIDIRFTHRVERSMK